MRSLLLGLLVLLLAGVVVGRRTRHPDDEEDFEFEEETQAQRRQRNPTKTQLQDGQDGLTFSSKKMTGTRNAEDSELCLALRCSKDEYCLVKNENVALCVSSKKSRKGRKLLPTPSKPLNSAAEDDEDEEDDADSDDDNSSDDDDDDDESSNEYEDDSAERGRSSCNPCPVAKPTFVCGSDNKTYSSPCRLHYHNCVHRSTILLGCKGFCPCKENKVKHEQKQKQLNQRWNHFVNKYKTTVDIKNNSTPTSSASGDQHQLGIKSASNSVNKQRKPNKTELNAEHAKKTGKGNNSANKGTPTLAEDKERQKGYNSVLEKDPASNKAAKKECSSHDLQAMENRLLDWFSVVMADAKRNKSKKRPRVNSVVTSTKTVFPSQCQQEVQWIFSHLDSDEDGRLQMKELQDLEHDGREQCLRPFLDHCDSTHDMRLSPKEWCACFDHSGRPCLSSKIKSRNGLLGTFNPSCDEDGFFLATQCHASTGICWCVDRHGVEYVNTRKRGKPECENITGRNASSSPESTDEDDDNEGDDDDDDDNSMMEGSADQPLDI